MPPKKPVTSKATGSKAPAKPAAGRGGTAARGAPAARGGPAGRGGPAKKGTTPAAGQGRSYMV